MGGKVEPTEKEFFARKNYERLIEKKKEKKLYELVKRAVIDGLKEFHKNSCKG
jgi:hypothetical protein